MKAFNKFLGLSAVAMLTLGFASCSNDLNSPEEVPASSEGLVLNLLKSPDVIAWSGPSYYANTFGASKAGDETTTTTSSVYLHNEEVEVNLSLLDDSNSSKYDDGIADLVSKLSIHVRCATDVEVTLPIPVSYVIESDDLYIFHEHFVEGDGNGVYGATIAENSPLGEDATQSVKFNVRGKDVTLTITHNAENIVVKTEGIDQDVIDACFAKNSDGLNFEVYNYYQTATVDWSDPDKQSGEVVDEEVSRSEVQELLNTSKVKFVVPSAKGVAPKYYINAFGWQMLDEYDYSEGNVAGDAWHADAVNPNDCTVEPESADYVLYVGDLYVDGEVAEEDAEQFYHLNGTPYNSIYVLDGETPDHAHGYFETSAADDTEEEGDLTDGQDPADEV